MNKILISYWVVIWILVGGILLYTPIVIDGSLVYNYFIYFAVPLLVILAIIVLARKNISWRTKFLQLALGIILPLIAGIIFLASQIQLNFGGF